jgi:hypothetical protein
MACAAARKARPCDTNEGEHDTHLNATACLEFFIVKGHTIQPNRRETSALLDPPGISDRTRQQASLIFGNY